MEDKLEKLVKGNRDVFDDFTPPGDMWNRISDEIAPTKKNNIKLIIIKASGIAALFVISFFAYQFFNADNTKNYTSENFLKEFQETELYYSGLINTKKETVYQLTSDTPEIKEEIEMELSILDSTMTELKNDLKDNISNAEVVEAMIQNYRMKLKILEDILRYIKPTNEKDVKTESSVNI